MKSSVATKILYDGPDSFFRASKYVAQKELSGTTMKTTKPRESDIQANIVTSAKSIELINQLENFDTLIQGISEIFINGANVAPFGTTDKYAKEAIKTIGRINASMRSLKTATLPVEDLNQMEAVMIGVLDSIDQIPVDTENLTVDKMLSGSEKLISDITQFLDIKRGYMTDTITAGLPIIENVPQPPQIVGAGRFNVLSDRAKHIQKSPYKRFI